MATHFFFFSSRRRHTRSLCDWSSDVCSSDLIYTGSPGHLVPSYHAVYENCPDRFNPASRSQAISTVRKCEGLVCRRSEERRVGKECRSGRSRYNQKKQQTIVVTLQAVNEQMS